MNRKPSAITRGFTLVELLAAIAVIGIMAGLAIISMNGIYANSKEQVKKRHAQNIVNVFNAARSAGNTQSYDLDSAIVAVTSSAGIPGAATFEGSRFFAPMANAERDAARPLISSHGDGSELNLVYLPEE
jgi:prepilin-type N-terminal cleavage/methylation domain-containing protein